jgi:hypothetical protein
MLWFPEASGAVNTELYGLFTAEIKKLKNGDRSLTHCLSVTMELLTSSRKPQPALDIYTGTEMDAKWTNLYS